MTGMEDMLSGGWGSFPKKDACQQKRRATELANSKKCPLECNFPYVEMIKLSIRKVSLYF